MISAPSQTQDLATNINPWFLVCPEDGMIPRIFYVFEKNDLMIILECPNAKHNRKMSYTNYQEKLRSLQAKASKGFCNFIQSHSSKPSWAYCINCKSKMCSLCVYSHEITSKSRKKQKNKNIKTTRFNDDAMPFYEIDNHQCTVVPCGWEFINSGNSGNNNIYFDCAKVHEPDRTQNPKLNAIINEDEINEFTKNFQTFEKTYFKHWDDAWAELIRKINVQYSFNYKVNKQWFSIVNSNIHMYSLLKSWKNTNTNLVNNMKDIMKKANFTLCKYVKDGTVEDNARDIISFLKHNLILDLNTSQTLICEKTIEFNKKIYAICRISCALFAIGFNTGEIYILSYPALKVVHVLDAHDSGIWKWYYSKRKSRLVSLSSDNTMRIWEPTSGAWVAIWEGHQGTVRGVEEWLNGDIISCSSDRCLKFWDCNTRKCYKTIYEAHHSPIYNIVILQDGRIVTGGWDCNWKIWNQDAVTKRDYWTILPHFFDIQAWLQLRDERWIVGTNQSIFVYDVTDFKKWAELKKSQTSEFSFLELSNGMMISSNDYCMIWWDWQEYKLKQILCEHKDYIYNGIIEWERGVVLSGAIDKNLKIWKN